MLLCEFILNSTRAPPGEEFLYHTLLELHLIGHQDTPTESSTASPQELASVSGQKDSLAASPQHEDQVSVTTTFCHLFDMSS